MLKEQARALEEQGKYTDQLLSQLEAWWHWWHHHWYEIREDTTNGKTEVASEGDALLACLADARPVSQEGVAAVALTSRGIDYSKWDAIDTSSDEEEEEADDESGEEAEEGKEEAEEAEEEEEGVIESEEEEDLWDETYEELYLAQASGDNRDDRKYEWAIAADEEEKETHDEASACFHMSDSDRKQAILEKLHDAERIVQAMSAKVDAKLDMSGQTSTKFCEMQQQQQQQLRTYIEMVEIMSAAEFTASGSLALEALIDRWKGDLVTQLSSLLSDQNFMERVLDRNG